MIKILDKSICQDCKIFSCSFLRTSLTRHDFCKLTSETTVCPTQILTDGPYESAYTTGVIDKDASSKKVCIGCGLCVKNCAYSNLVFSEDSFNIDTDLFAQLTEPQLKAVVTSYLGFLFAFSANTNRNRALQFDGFISSESENRAFVEIDWNNDSLECSRRLLGDILTYRSAVNINEGLIVLRDIPSLGSRDIYNVLEKIKAFPTTSNISIYITSIPILRWLALHSTKTSFNLSEIGYNPLSDTKESYLIRLNEYFGPENKISNI